MQNVPQRARISNDLQTKKKIFKGPAISTKIYEPKSQIGLFGCWLFPKNLNQIFYNDWFTKISIFFYKKCQRLSFFFILK